MPPALAEHAADSGIVPTKARQLQLTAMRWGTSHFPAGLWGSSKSGSPDTGQNATESLSDP